ncbi:MAG TPA: hypothetical protein VLN26_08105, partial [Gaiellaceae bacterium]|nr:hypothetical protein [Gaiellaceae bacterium]
TLLVRDGFGLWDNLWYGGHYPLASYSLLYYLPASIVGNRPLVLVAAVIAAALFASVVHAEWPAVGRWPARIFAVLAAGPLFTGTYSYALGLAALLGSVRALQARRTWLAVACAALTLGFSPLAFVLLCLVLTAALVTRRRFERRTLLMAGALALLVGVELAALTLFPYDGVYPFHGWALLAALGVGVLGVGLSLRSRRAAPLAAFFVLWMVASAAAYFVQTPLGANLVRIQLLIFPLMLLAALLAEMRPRPLVALALAAAFASNTVPYALMAAQRTTSVFRAKESWQPALAFLRAHKGPDFRVEVVPTIEHWEAYYVPAAGFALARGWYRQLDLAQNPLLYRKQIAPAAYQAWLRRLGVRYVLLPSSGIDSLGAGAEARLLQSGTSGLRPVFADPLWTIYELPRPTPIITGPGGAGLTVFSHSRVAGWTKEAARYTLRVRYMRYWRVVAGSVCLAPSRDGSTTVLVVRKPGRFALASDEQPGQVIENVVAAHTAACARRDR